ncbi:MAG: hypothetical protein KDC80_28125 [Saprospiraceae bacterium]|nr:hypothetical protein [Saprospiraceae bacterium]
MKKTLLDQVTSPIFVLIAGITGCIMGIEFNLTEANAQAILFGESSFKTYLFGFFIFGAAKYAGLVLYSTPLDNIFRHKGSWEEIPFRKATILLLFITVALGGTTYFVRGQIERDRVQIDLQLQIESRESIDWTGVISGEGEKPELKSHEMMLELEDMIVLDTKIRIILLAILGLTVLILSSFLFTLTSLLFPAVYLRTLYEYSCRQFDRKCQQIKSTNHLKRQAIISLSEIAGLRAVQDSRSLAHGIFTENKNNNQ